MEPDDPIVRMRELQFRRLVDATTQVGCATKSVKAPVLQDYADLWSVPRPGFIHENRLSAAPSSVFETRDLYRGASTQDAQGNSQGEERFDWRSTLRGHKLG
jgi:hypothetical protein